MRLQVPKVRRQWRPWLVGLAPILLAACASPGPETPRIESPYSLTPAFAEVDAAQNDPQTLIEQELEADEVEQFRTFLSLLSNENRTAFLLVVSQMDVGVRGFIVANHVLPDPEAGRNFAILAKEIGPENQGGLGRVLSTNSQRRWKSLRSGLNDRIIDEENYDLSDLLPALWPITYPDPPSPTQYRRIADLLDGGGWYLMSPMINAERAPPGAAPWQIQLARAGKDRAYYHHPKRVRSEFEKFGRTRKEWERDHICGAVYIGNNFALTAAHCVQGWVGYDAEFFAARRIRAGTDDISEEGQIIEISALVMHASYEDGNSYKGYDIALLMLAEEPTSPGTSRTRIPLHPRNGQQPGTELVQTGWGLTGATNSSKSIRDLKGNLQRSARFLRLGKLALFEGSACDNDQAFIDQSVKLGFGQICVGSDEGVDACKGDSGGPLVRMTEDKPPILVGLVSWGIGCGIENRPAIYTDVGAFYSWIKKAQKRARKGKIIRLK